MTQFHKMSAFALITLGYFVIYLIVEIGLAQILKYLFTFFFVLFQEWICHVNLLPTKNPQVYFITLPRAKWIMEQCCVWLVI